MTYAQLGSCFIVALGFLAAGLVVGKVQDVLLEKEMKKQGPFLITK